MAPSASDINAAVTRINSFFHFANDAKFTLCGMSYINDSRFYNITSYETRQIDFYNAYHKNNAINIYITETTLRDFAQYPTGDYTSPSVFMHSLSYDLDFKVLAHELGHTFGLSHTFNDEGRESERVVRDDPFSQKPNPPNWGTAADRMKETAADHPLCSPVLINCNIPPCTVVDDNGDLYNPDKTNLMSYWTCFDRFVSEQQRKMDDQLDTRLSYLINANCTENTGGLGVLERVPVCADGNDTKIKVKNASVNILNSNNNLICTPISDLSGYFTSCNLPKNTPIILNPVFNSNPKNGVTTFDIALISSHNLGIQPLTEPFTLLAADVDNSGEIDALDMLYIRRLILNQISSFPNGVNSWRFVPQYFLQQPSFLNSFNQDPFNASYQGYCYNPSSCSSYMDKVTLDLNTQDGGSLWAWTFRPFKVGDVNCSYNLNAMSAQPVIDILQDYSTAQTLSARMASDRYKLHTSRNIAFRNADEKTIILKAKSIGHITAMQLGMGFLKSKLSIKDIEKGDFNTSNDVFDFSKEDRGELRALWFNKRGQTKEISNGTILLKAKVKANANIDDILNVLNLDDNILKNEFYDASGNLIPMDLEWELAENSSSIVNNLTVNAFPNPFKNGVTFEVNSPINGLATISISNIVTGQNMTFSRQLIQGVNSIVINNTVNLSQGMLTYSVAVGGQVINGSITKSR